MGRKKILFLIEIPIFAALALLLDIIPWLSLKLWAQGGSASFAMIPIFIMAYRWGLKGGLLSGFLYGMLQIIVGDAYIVQFFQGVLDYGIAFTGIGLAGVFAKPIHRSLAYKRTKSFILYIIMGTLLGSFIRFIAHFCAGLIYFGGTWQFSLIYNGSYMLPNFIISTIAVYLLFSLQPRLLLENKR